MFAAANKYDGAKSVPGRSSPMPASETSDCLHCQINDVVVAFLEQQQKSGEMVEAHDIISMMAECIVDMILQQEDSHQAELLAQAMGSLGDLYLKKRDEPRDTTH
jgi:hypothetical protein